MATQASKPLVVVYHADCIDGAACAWAVAKAWNIEKEPHPNVTYIPYAHHDVESAENKIRAAMKADAEVYFVDVAPNKQFLDELMTPDAGGNAKAQAIHVMDHHNSAAAMLANYKPPAAEGPQPQLEIFIDQTRDSAARMVWEKLLPGETVPPVLDVINMMDGDAKSLTSPHDFAAAAIVDTRDISTPNKAFRTLRGLAKLTFNQMARSGYSILKDQDVKIDKMLDNASCIALQVLPNQPPVPVAIVNADVKQYGRQVSDRLIQLGKKAGSGVAFAWYMQQNGVVTMSIRTSGQPDASMIADHLRKTMGVTGGGHEGAGAVHFASLFEFARQMPLHNKQPAIEPAQKVVLPPQRQKDGPGKHLH
jgi:nanoRNase/pAp phosphatase (c-di-AMP/oligoRNAs hydrolase)